MTINQLIQDSKKQAQSCAKSAVRFKRTFFALAWADLAFGLMSLYWGPVIIWEGANQHKWFAVFGGLVIVFLAVMWFSSIQRHCREAEDQFEKFMNIRQRALDNMKTLEELKQELGGDFDNSK